MSILCVKYSKISSLLLNNLLEWKQDISKSYIFVTIKLDIRVHSHPSFLKPFYKSKLCSWSSKDLDNNNAECYVSLRVRFKASDPIYLFTKKKKKVIRFFYVITCATLLYLAMLLKLVKCPSWCYVQCYEYIGCM